MRAGTGFAAAQRAIHARDRHGGHEFRHHRRAPRCLQHAPQRLRADARMAAQAGTVFYLWHLCRWPAQLPPLCQRCAPGFQATHAHALFAQGQQHLLGHHVVAVFVDIAHHFRQGGGAGFPTQASALQAPRRRPHATRELPAHAAPHAFHGLEGETLQGLSKAMAQFLSPAAPAG